jgi:hypothetical protein
MKAKKKKANYITKRSQEEIAGVIFPLCLVKSD